VPSANGGPGTLRRTIGWSKSGKRVLGPSVRKLYLILALACCAGPAVAAQKPIVKLLTCRFHARRSAPVGQRLSGRNGRVPAILVRTPYGKGADITPNYQAFVEHGYAMWCRTCAGATNRGRVPAADTRSRQDGDDTLNWIARQPWSTARSA
jgi:hypothetical protein